MEWVATPSSSGSSRLRDRTCVFSGSYIAGKFLTASFIAQLVKNLPAVQGTLVQFLGQEDPPEKG